MVLAAHFPLILAVHVDSVVLSGGLFSARAVLRIAGSEAANHGLLRGVSYLIDTVLLAAAILLTLIVRQYPFVDAWLTAKVLLLLAYVALGSLALRRARTRRGRIAAALGAWTTFALIVGVAVTRDPAGWFALIRR